MSQLECRLPFPITPFEILEQMVLAPECPQTRRLPLRAGRSDGLSAVISMDTLITSEAAADRDSSFLTFLRAAWDGGKSV